MLKYLITLSSAKLKLIEYAKTWKQAQILADAWANDYSTCTVTIAEVLSIQTKGEKK